MLLLSYGAVVTPPSLTFLQVTEDTGNNSSYSFASQSFGTADATRRVVVVATWAATSSSLTLSNPTIGGVAATIHTQIGSNPNIGIFSALVPTGTSGTIAFDLGATAARASIAVYRAVNSGASPFATASDTTMSSNVLSTTIDIPQGGWVVAGATTLILSGNTHTWVGVNEDYDSPYGDAAGRAKTGGFASGLSSQTGRTISATVSGTGSGGFLAAMSWGA